MTALAPTLQAFFTDRLIRQRHASPHTIAAYRDTLRLLLGFAASTHRHRTVHAGPGRPRRAPDRRVPGPPRTRPRQQRPHPQRPPGRDPLAVPLRRPAPTPNTPPAIARVLAIPPKRFDRALISYLTEPEIDALLAACDQTTWTGRRDHALLLLAVQTGLRISELIGLTRADLHLGAGAHVACHGKGRKDRITPLTTQHRRRAARLARRTRRRPRPRRCSPPAAATRSAATPSSAGSPLHRTGRRRAARRCTTRRSPRTSCGTPPRCGCCTPASTPAVIALWLGHDSIDTTQIYLHADLTLKEQALARTTTSRQPGPAATDPPTRLLAWLEAL